MSEGGNIRFDLGELDRELGTEGLLKQVIFLDFQELLLEGDFNQVILSQGETKESFSPATHLSTVFDQKDGKYLVEDRQNQPIGCICKQNGKFLAVITNKSSQGGGKEVFVILFSDNSVEFFKKKTITNSLASGQALEDYSNKQTLQYWHLKDKQDLVSTGFSLQQLGLEEIQTSS
jgi:hypothetical protein